MKKQTVVKRFLSLALTIVMVVGISVPVMASAAPNLNTASTWAHEGISRAFVLGLVPPNLQGAYTQATTRAEFAALAVTLYETVTNTEIAGRMEFNDTADINVQKMGYLGVVLGVGYGNFAPDNTLTREQAATMLYRLANTVMVSNETWIEGWGAPFDPDFADTYAIADWARRAVTNMQNTGIMDGVGDNMFAAQGDYTREQSIITMLRLFDIVTADEIF